MYDCDWSIRTVTGPTHEPITLEEARVWAKFDADDTSQDAMILGIIVAARRYAENYTGRAFVQRTLELRFPYFPSHVIELPRPPLRSVSYVRYIDVDGTEQVLGGSPDEFQVELYREPGRIQPLYLNVWPTTYGRNVDEVRIGYVAGYAGEPPDELKLWMQSRVTMFDCHREPIAPNNIQVLPHQFVDGILDPLVIPHWWK